MDTIQERYLEMCVESMMILLSSVETLCNVASYLLNESKSDNVPICNMLNTTEITLSSFQQNLCTRLADLHEFEESELNSVSRSEDNSMLDKILDHLKYIETILETESESEERPKTLLEKLDNCIPWDNL